ncbi:uncharacterized protein LOC132047875 [Lycium ferocissimum]|uniref:uncharacterized protein LOC132047875 n=1 Tax=Lycium ferocissimum TaxID=112874 RepID=UPI0028158D4F|nr:uncharacterized protein LOC132047875 [Lycium ferocissimum]
MPFGLKNPGPTFQWLVTMMFKDQLGKTMEVYIDDMVVKSERAEDHLIHLKEVFAIIRQLNMKLNPEKCAFNVSSGKFLGFMVSKRGIEINSDQIKAIENIPDDLNNIKEQQNFEWKPECKQALQELKRYPHLEKLALALIRAARKLRHYFPSHPIAVVTTFRPRSVLHRPELSDRLAKWAIELSEFDITYQPRNAIKSHILADFVADFNSKLTSEVEKETITNTGLSSGIWTLYTDKAFNESLKLALEYGAKSNRVHCDSQLVVNQVNGTFSIKDLRMQKYQTQILDLFARFKEWELEQVPRESNAKADSLAKLASVADPGEPGSRSVIHLLHPIGCEIEVHETGSAHDWRNKILNFLQQGTQSIDKKKARKLRVKAIRYCLVYGELYQRTFGGLLAKCLSPNDTEPTMQQVHSGYRGNHSSGRSLARCLLRAGYYWNTIDKDSQNFVCRCKECQAYASAIHHPAEPLHLVITPWPFMKWGLDIMGPFPEAKVLWSYRVTYKTSTRGTLFSLVYGAKVLVPIDVMEPSIRYVHATDAENVEAMKDGLDLLEEHRELALIKLKTSKQQVERYYNNKTKLRQIKVGDLVMRMVTSATKIPNEGKLGANWEGPYKVIADTGKGTFQLETLDGKIVSNNYNISNLKLFHS